MAKKTLKSAKEKKLPKLRKVGFRSRMKTASGRAILKRRRARGRKYLTAIDHMRKVNKRPKNKKK